MLEPLFSPVVVFQECPSGVVNEETFKEIYSQFFPQGGLCCPVIHSKLMVFLWQLPLRPD